MTVIVALICALRHCRTWVLRVATVCLLLWLPRAEERPTPVPILDYPHHALPQASHINTFWETDPPTVLTVSNRQEDILPETTASQIPLVEPRLAVPKPLVTADLNPYAGDS